MLRKDITWKVHADTVANCCRIQLERMDIEGKKVEAEGVNPIETVVGSIREYENFRDLCKGCVGAEYKLDYEDLIWLGYPYTPGDIRFINNGGTYAGLLLKREAKIEEE